MSLEGLGCVETSALAADLENVGAIAYLRVKSYCLGEVRRLLGEMYFLHFADV